MFYSGLLISVEAYFPDPKRLGIEKGDDKGTYHLTQIAGFGFLKKNTNFLIDR